MAGTWIYTVIILAWIIIQIGGFILLIWLGWRYFDQRYKTGNKNHSIEMLNGELERTPEVFVDPKDGFTYRVYYNHKTGEREYVREYVRE
jgi:hypothetical protein